MNTDNSNNNNTVNSPLSFSYIDKFKIINYKYLLSSIHIDKTVQNNLVEEYTLNLYKDKVEEYCYNNKYKDSKNNLYYRLENYSKCIEMYERNYKK